MVILDSITELKPEHRDQVVLAGSHGGIYCAHLAASAGVKAVILNDAGIGRDEAGTEGLYRLDKIHLPAVAIAHDSARIGDGRDMAERGLLSRVNGASIHYGCKAGQTAAEAAERLEAALPAIGKLEILDEARVELAPGVLGMDSVSLLGEGDGDRIVVAGSHGGLLRGRPDYVIRRPVRAIVFHDAGIGIDRAGVSRIEPCAGMGVPAAAAAAASARIGDARSIWSTGILSTVNSLAEGLGARPGMTVPEFAELIP